MTFAVSFGRRTYRRTDISLPFGRYNISLIFCYVFHRVFSVLLLQNKTPTAAVAHSSFGFG